MLEEVASQILAIPFHKVALDLFTKSAGLASLALTVESLMHKAKDSKKDEENLFLTACKTIQIMACLNSMPFFASYKTNLSRVIIGGIAAVIGGGVFLHQSQYEEEKAPSMKTLAILSTLNIVVKVVNSFAIGLSMHEACFEGQRPGAFMLGTTVTALGFSAFNVFKDLRSFHLL